MNDLSDLMNSWISERAVQSGGYSNTEVEGIKTMNLHVCAVGEEA